MASAMETGIRSSLNPNAEPFIPMAYRLVEDFSPLWWELVKTSPWFQDYWSTHHRLDDYDEDLDGIEDDDVWVDDGFEFVGPQYVNESSSPFDFFAREKKLQKGVQTDVDAKTMLKKLNLGIPDSIDKGRGSNPRGPSWCCKNKQQQRIKYVAPKFVVRCIHQPR